MADGQRALSGGGWNSAAQRRGRPFWSITAIVIGVFVIWAVAAHGGALRDASV